MAKMMVGRRSVFRNKKRRVQGLITEEAYAALQAGRKRLAALTQRELGVISDADGIEFCIRGESNVSVYLKAQRRRGW